MIIFRKRAFLLVLLALLLHGHISFATPSEAESLHQELTGHQRIFEWIPALDNKEEITLWYINSFLVRLRGGSFYELPLEQVHRFLGAIPRYLRTSEHLGFHDVAGIQPFHFVTAENMLHIPEENRDYFREMYRSIGTWVEIYERDGVDALIRSLVQLPNWMRIMAEFQSSISERDLRPLCDKLWDKVNYSQALGSIDEHKIQKIMEGLSEIYDSLAKADPQRSLIRRIYFPLSILKGVASLYNGTSTIRSLSLTVEEEAQILQQMFGYLINHEFFDGRRESRLRLFIRTKLAECEKIFKKKLHLRSGDQKDVFFLISSGLAGILRGNFCEQPTCATGRHGEHNQHRNSTLCRDNLLLIPVIDGEIKGYIEFMQERVVGQPEGRVLVLKTVQFDGLTENGALILLSYLHHQVKRSGFIGIALPRNFEGKSNITENKTILSTLTAYRNGRPMTVIPVHSQDWRTARRSFGRGGGTYYEENVNGAYIFLSEQALLPEGDLQVIADITPQIRQAVEQEEREKFRQARSEVLLGIGLSLKSGGHFDAYCALLSTYGHHNVRELLEERESQDVFQHLITLFENELSPDIPSEKRAQLLKNELEYLFKSVPWREFFRNGQKRAENLFGDFIGFLGRERFLRSYQHSMNLRTDEVLKLIDDEWVVFLFERVSGNRALRVLDRIYGNNLELKKRFLERIRSRVIVFLADPLPQNRDRACEIVTIYELALHPQIKESLLHLLHDSDEEVRESAAKGLYRVANEEVVQESLLEMLEDSEDRVRVAAARSLSFATKNPKVVDTLLRILEPEALPVALPASEAPQVLQFTDDDESDYVRAAAAEALLGMGLQPRVRRVLIQLLDDRSDAVREAAVSSLGPLALLEVDVQEVLLRKLQDPESHVRAAVVRSLRHVVSRATVQAALIERLRLEEDDGNREAIVIVLTRAASYLAVQQALMALLHNSSFDVQEAAVKALAPFVLQPEVQNAFIQLLEDTDVSPDVTIEIVLALISSGNPSEALANNLLGRLADEDVLVGFNNERAKRVWQLIEQRNLQAAVPAPLRRVLFRRLDIPNRPQPEAQGGMPNDGIWLTAILDNSEGSQQRFENVLESIRQAGDDETLQALDRLESLLREDRLLDDNVLRELAIKIDHVQERNTHLIRAPALQRIAMAQNAIRDNRARQVVQHPAQSSKPLSEESLDSLQDIFQWIPSLDNKEEITLWYINTFLVRLQGGSFYELSLDQILRYFSAIPQPLQNSENLGFHNVADIRPFHFITSDGRFEIPPNQRSYVEELMGSLQGWIRTYRDKGLGSLASLLLETPSWMYEMDEFKSKQSEDDLNAVRTLVGEDLWNARSFEENALQSLSRKLSQQYDTLGRGDIRLPMLRRVLFAVAFLQGFSSMMPGGEMTLEDQLKGVQQVLGYLLNHEFLHVPRERRNRGRNFTENKLRAFQHLLNQRLSLKQEDQRKVFFLVSNGLSGILRGNFCEQPTCATGRHGENNQHRNSTLVPDNLLLIPVIDGEIRGYIEFMQENIVGRTDRVLVLKTIQFDGLTEQGAHVLFSYLHHLAKKNGFVGIAIPSNLNGKSNIEANKRVLNSLRAYQIAHRIAALTPLDETAWAVARKSFGPTGGQYYEEEHLDAYVLLNEAHLLKESDLRVVAASQNPSVEPTSNQRERENIRQARSEILIGVGLSLKEGEFYKLYLRLLDTYGRQGVRELLQAKAQEDFFTRVVGFFENEVSAETHPQKKEKILKDSVEYLLKSIRWKNFFEANEPLATKLFRAVIDYIGRDRFIHAYQASVKVRTERILNFVSTDWLISLLERVSGNRLPMVLQALTANKKFSQSDLERLQVRIIAIFNNERDPSEPVGHPDHRAAAFEVVKASGLARDPVIRKIALMRLNHRDLDVRHPAMRALAPVALEPEVQEALLDKLRCDNIGDRMEAVRVLCSTLSDPVVRAAVVERLKDENLSVRIVAVRALKSVVSETAVRDLLIANLRDTDFREDFNIRSEIVQAFAPVISDPLVQKVLLERLGNQNAGGACVILEPPDVRRAVINALLPVAIEPVVLKALIASLDDGMDEIAQAACTGLGSVASQPEVQQALLSVLSSEGTSRVRVLAMRALASAAPDHTLSGYITHLADENALRMLEPDQARTLWGWLGEKNLQNFLPQRFRDALLSRLGNELGTSQGSITSEGPGTPVAESAKREQVIAYLREHYLLLTDEQRVAVSERFVELEENLSEQERYRPDYEHLEMELLNRAIREVVARDSAPDHVVNGEIPRAEPVPAEAGTLGMTEVTSSAGSSRTTQERWIPLPQLVEDISQMSRSGVSTGGSRDSSATPRNDNVEILSPDTPPSVDEMRARAADSSPEPVLREGGGARNGRGAVRFNPFEEASRRELAIMAFEERAHLFVDRNGGVDLNLIHQVADGEVDEMASEVSREEQEKLQLRAQAYRRALESATRRYEQSLSFMDRTGMRVARFSVDAARGIPRFMLEMALADAVWEMGAAVLRLGRGQDGEFERILEAFAHLASSEFFVNYLTFHTLASTGTETMARVQAALGRGDVAALRHGWISRGAGVAAAEFVTTYFGRLMAHPRWREYEQNPSWEIAAEIAKDVFFDPHNMAEAGIRATSFMTASYIVEQVAMLMYRAPLPGPAKIIAGTVTFLLHRVFLSFVLPSIDLSRAQTEVVEARDHFLNAVNRGTLAELEEALLTMHQSFDNYRSYLHGSVFEAMREHQTKMINLDNVYGTRLAAFNVLEQVERFEEDGRISGPAAEIVYPRFSLAGRLYERLGSQIYDPNNMDPNFDVTPPYEGLPEEIVGSYAPTVWLMSTNRENLDQDHNGQLSEEEKRRIPAIVRRMIEQYEREKNTLENEYEEDLTNLASQGLFNSGRDKFLATLRRIEINRVDQQWREQGTPTERDFYGELLRPHLGADALTRFSLPQLSRNDEEREDALSPFRIENLGRLDLGLPGVEVDRSRDSQARGQLELSPRREGQEEAERPMIRITIPDHLRESEGDVRGVGVEPVWDEETRGYRWQSVVELESGQRVVVPLEARGVEELQDPRGGRIVLPEVPEEDMRQMLERWEEARLERRAESRLLLDGRVAVEELSENRLSTYGQEAAVLRYALQLLRGAAAEAQKIAVVESALEILGRQWLMDELSCAGARGIAYPDMEDLLQGIQSSTLTRPRPATESR